MPDTRSTQPHTPSDKTIEQGQSIPFSATANPLTAPDTNPAFGPPAAPDEIGQLGPYRIVKELGRGGMGAVYLAFDERLKRKVALKVMLPKYAANISSKNRFIREARAAAGLAHDHIVTVYEADERDGVPYMAMQFLQGYPLDVYLKQKNGLPLTEALRIGRETALGLAAAHEQGLAHRDIKPANLWVEAPTGRIKILDFGLARPTRDEDQDFDLTATGIILGTPAFMSPEQARGDKADHRADLFSLGVVLYQLTTGQTPFHGKTMTALLGSVLADTPPPVRELNPAVPETLAKLIHRLLEKDPARRPKSAAAVAEMLRKIEGGAAVPLHAIPLHSLPTQTKIPTGADPFAEIDATEPGEVVHAPTLPARQPMPKWPLIALAVLLIGVLAMIPQIISIMTPKGTLVIETTDPDVEVTVKKGTATIHDKTRQREIVLAVGDDYTIDLAEAKNGLKLNTKSFEITRNNKTTVKVRVEKPPVVATAPAKKDEPKPASFTNALGMEFMLVPKGSAWLGGHDSILGDRAFTLPQDMFVGRYEVTQTEWEALMGENPSSFSRAGAFRSLVAGIKDAELKRFPVEGVSWDDAQAFLAKLNAKVAEPGWEYRLPTEDEWEYACRGGPMTDKAESGYGYVFAKPSHEYGPDRSNYGSSYTPRRTCKVGSYEPNKLGLHDMQGNVWEWCGKPMPTAGKWALAYRGGSWNEDIPYHCSYRHPDPAPTLRGNGLGLRLVRVEKPTGPVRGQWVGPASTFIRVAAGKWLEKSADGLFSFDEVEATTDYVELQAADRDLRVRLSTDQAKLRVPNQKEFTLLEMGGWVPLAERTLIFDEDFGDKSKAWVGSSKDTRVTIKDGVYVTDFDAGKKDGGVHPFGPPAGDTAVEVRARCTDVVMMVNVRYFRQGDTRTVLFFSVRPDGTWLLGRNRKTDGKASGDETLVASKAPLPALVGGQWFTLAIENRGPRMVVSVNGQSVADVVDQQPPAGTPHDAAMKVGFFALNGKAGRGELDSVRIWALAATAEAAKATGPDRAAAEVIFAHNGQVQVNDGPGYIKRAADLPPGPFRLTRISSAGTPIPFAPADLEKVFFSPAGPLESLGGIVEGTDWLLPPDDFLERLGRTATAKSLRDLFLHTYPYTPARIKALHQFPALREVRLSGAKADDALLEKLADLPPWLELVGLIDFGKSGKVTATGIAAIGKLKYPRIAFGDLALPGLDLPRTLAAMPTLTDLNLYASADDAMLPVLGTSKSLKMLHLTESPKVTDAGLPALAGLTQLEALYLTGTKATEAGAKKLAAALPKCRIVYDGGVCEPKK